MMVCWSRVLPVERRLRWEGGVILREPSQVASVDVQQQCARVRLCGESGVAVIGFDDRDVTGLAVLQPAVCVHLHPAGDDDENLQGWVQGVVEGADPVGVSGSLEVVRFALVLVAELSVQVAARGGVNEGIVEVARI